MGSVQSKASEEASRSCSLLLGLRDDLHWPVGTYEVSKAAAGGFLMPRCEILLNMPDDSSYLWNPVISF